MRERAALYDGVLEAGPCSGGGYRVAATLRFAPRGGAMIRVLLADDQALVRAGFRVLIESEDGSRSSARRRTGPRRSIWP